MSEGHKVTARLVRDQERVWCTCGADLPSDHDAGAGVVEAVHAAAQRHLTDVLMSAGHQGDCDCCGWRWADRRPLPNRDKKGCEGA